MSSSPAQIEPRASSGSRPGRSAIDQRAHSFRIATAGSSKLAGSVALGIALAAASAIATSAGANLLTNGSFQTTDQGGDPIGWTSGGNYQNVSVVNAATCAQFGFCFGDQDADGNWVDAGPVGADGTLSQTFTDTPGRILHVSGWLAGDGGSPSDFSMSIGETTYLSVNPVPDQTWSEYAFTAPATGFDTFTVSFRNDPGLLGLDDFVVSETVPEPASLALLGAALAGFGLFRRRRRQA
jgi:PEP-CTERM motif-containing protein